MGCSIANVVLTGILVLTLVAVIGVTLRFTGWRAIIAMVLVAVLGFGLTLLAVAVMFRACAR